ncbi:MAG: 23S rRNA (cytosine(1962)-C(5))-methyltransferase RlmI [Calditrichaeota bacterium]|nr:MAG: 23S rRNA (cytosine(1962)-C(5))-methyltransferase RlmI [Calditrichota bacterium]
MKIVLKPKRDESLRRRHPWIFSGAIAAGDGAPALGETVDVYSAEHEWLARAAWSPHSQIRARVWTFAEQEIIDSSFFHLRLERALSSRRHYDDDETTAVRLVNSESDGLPGLIVDRYADWLVCQFLSAGAELWKPVIIDHLANLWPTQGIYERSDAPSRQKEGLKPLTGCLAGSPPPELIQVHEHGLKLNVDIKRGHKTGLYLDQRENRQALAPFCRDSDVLNCFAYTGGFGLWALRGGAAHITNVDSSEEALLLAEKNAHLNGFASSIETIRGDVFQILRRFREEKRRPTVVILDPPKFAENIGQIQRASRGYKDINMLAMQILKPGGILFTFSCSGHIAPPLFQKIVADAAVDADREVQIIRQLSQAADHPVKTSFPEGLYLKGLICRVG